MKGILSIFLVMVFTISLAGFASAESNQSTQLTAQEEAPAPMAAPMATPKAPVKTHHKKSHKKTAPKPTPGASSEAPAPETN